MVVKEGTELAFEPDCRIARGGYWGGGGRRRAVCGRVSLTLWNVDWVSRDLRPGCGSAFAPERSLGSRRLEASLPHCARRLSVGWGPPPRGLRAVASWVHPRGRGIDLCISMRMNS